MESRSGVPEIGHRSPAAGPLGTLALGPQASRNGGSPETPRERRGRGSRQPPAVCPDSLQRTQVALAVSSLSEFLAHRIMRHKTKKKNGCCFKSLSFEVICYSSTR